MNKILLTIYQNDSTTAVAGMAVPCSAPSHGAILRHNSKFHGSWTVAQVLCSIKLVPSIQPNFPFRSICQQICYTDMLPFEDIPDDTVRPNIKVTRNGMLSTGSCHCLPQGASPVGHCEETPSHLPRLRWRADRLAGSLTSLLILNLNLSAGCHKLAYCYTIFLCCPGFEI